MQTIEPQSKPDWRAILVFYFLACAWSWPFFWWRDMHPASWNAWRFPAEFKGFTQQWGPGLAAITVLYFFPRVRARFIFLSGSSWTRSAVCFLTPIAFACVAAGFQPAHFTWRLPYQLVVFGVSCLGEELGWRGFLQGALRPMGRIRGYLLLSFLWAAWHLTSQTGGTWQGLISRLEVLLPTVVAVTFVLALLTERTGSLVLASAAHEWLDIGVDVGGYLLWVALAAVPVWLWIAWRWPKHKLILDENSKDSFAAHVQRY